MGQFKLRTAFGILVGGLTFASSSSVYAEELTPAQAVLSEDARSLSPTSGWNIDYGQNRCRLTRLFGDKDNQHLLYIEQIAPQSTFTVAFAGPLMDRWRRKRNVHVGLREAEPFEKIEFMKYGELGQFGPMITFKTSLTNETRLDDELRYAGIDTDLAGQVDRIVLRRKDDVLSFETGKMEKAFSALNACTADLLVGWGLDPQKHKSYLPVRMTDGADGHRDIIEEMPSRVLRKAPSGSYDWLVRIDKEGKATKCTAIDAEEGDEFANEGCEAIMKVAFNAARDGQGNTIDSFTTVHIILGQSPNW